MQEIELRAGECLLVNPARNLERVLEEIVAEGHTSVSLHRNQYTQDWGAESHLGRRDVPDLREDYEAWKQAVQLQRADGNGPIEAAEALLRQIRARQAEEGSR